MNYFKKKQKQKQKKERKKDKSSLHESKSKEFIQSQLSCNSPMAYIDKMEFSGFKLKFHYIFLFFINFHNYN